MTTSRRHLLAAAGGVVLAGCSSGSGGPDASPATTDATPTSRPATTTSTAGATPASCALSKELTAGPYHLDGHLVRRDITEGRPGSPLVVRVQVLDAASCRPLANAAVDVWHADANGEYSGFNGNSLAETQREGRNDARWLRGIQLTDEDGWAEFRTIFPGWYEGRTVHLHLEVREGGVAGRTYAGGHVAHVGQIFFEEPLTASVLADPPYTAHGGQRTTNEQDGIYRQVGAAGLATATAARVEGEAGHRCTFTCTVDPDATPPPAPLF